MKMHERRSSDDIADSAAAGPIASDSAGQSFPNPIPSFAFNPLDSWTLAFQRGLLNADFAQKTVYEVGVGTGANVAFLLKECGAAKVYGSDVDSRLSTVAQELVSFRIPEKAHYFIPLHGSISLINSPEASTAACASDAIIACIPQAVDTDDHAVASFMEAHYPLAKSKPESRQADYQAHYYPFEQFRHYQFNRFGLGLNEALLDSIRRQAPQADIIVNLSGRAGKQRLLDMFRSYRYEPTVLHKAIVPQCSKTSIAYYAALETHLEQEGLSLESEFFMDSDGVQPISAREAERLRTTEPSATLYHSLYVMRARPEAIPSGDGN
ncbi:hypothetical protein [Noviherbaspirillum sp. ST9]|uniref:hypothetical protein n=1 Tax=Noviherbaspirillum sp. ST9 TaxID=3401606 RepID=UPI003B588422